MSELAGLFAESAAKSGRSPEVYAAAAIPASERPPEPTRSDRIRQWRDASRRARRRRRYGTRIELVVQTEAGWRVVARHDLDGDDVGSALDAAIQEAAFLLTPLSDDERRNPRHTGYTFTPLTHDVVVCLGGRVLAVVSPTGSVPSIHMSNYHPTKEVNT